MRLVVIGGMGAGLSAASRARRVDRSLDIMVLEKGAEVSISACGLPYYVAGRIGAVDELRTYDADYFRRERNIAIRTRARVESVRHGNREVVLDGDERVHYDRLILATGGRPAKIPLEGAADNAFTLNSFEDAERLREFLDRYRPRRAAVIGAGYIGLEMVCVLRFRGVAVQVADSSAHVLGRADHGLTSAVKEHLERSGVELRLGMTAAELKSLEADLFVIAAGLLPNVAIAADAGVRLGSTGAIAVSDRMETSVNGVFAAGDCAEAMHVVTGKPVYIPLGTTANRMGRIAGACAAGGRERFTGVTGTSAVQFLGLSVAVSGLCASDAKREGFDPVSARIEAHDRAKYFQAQPTTVELVADRRTHKLLGGHVIGGDSAAGRANVIAAALTGGLRVEDFEQLDLAYTPPLAPAMDPLLVASRQLLKLLD